MLSICRSINRTVTYTDLSLEPVIDRENPPDLKPLADAAVATPKREAPAAATAPEGATSSQKASAKKFQKPERAAREATLNPLDVVALAKTLAAQVTAGTHANCCGPRMVKMNSPHGLLPACG